MRKPIQLNRTIKIDEYEASIFYDGSIIFNTVEKDLLCLDFHDLEILLQKTIENKDTVQANF